MYSDKFGIQAIKVHHCHVFTFLVYYTYLFNKIHKRVIYN